MKANFLKFSALAIVVGLAAVACQKKEEPKAATPVLTITASSSMFAANAATATLNLSSAATEDVVVELTASGNLADAVTFDSQVTIAKGNSSQSVKVTLNPDNLAVGDYTVEIVIAKATGAEVSSSANSVNFKYTVGEPETPEVKTVEVNMDSPKVFADGKAVLKLYPSEAPEADVTVTLALAEAATLAGAVLAPAEAVTFPATVTIPAGSDADVEAVVEVKVAALEPGLNEVGIVIASVSENATIGDKKSASIAAEGLIRANLRSDWTITDNGLQDGYDIFSYSVGDDENWYAFYYDEGAVAESFEDMTEFVRYLSENVIDRYIGTQNAYTVRTGSLSLRYSRLNVGSYDFYLLGADAAGHLTGDYATLTVKREATAEMKAIYESWLGEWEVNHKTWTIAKDNEENVTYTITGIDGVNLSVSAALYWDGSIEIYNQEGLYTDEDGDVYGLYGLLTTSEGTSLWGGYFPIAYASFNDEAMETATITGAPVSGTTVFTSMAFLVLSASDGKYYFVNSQVAFPAAMARPSELIIDETPVKAAAYEDFIGSWNYSGYDLVIAAGEAENTYLIAGFPDEYEEYDPVVATFSDGKLYIATQDFGTWTNTNYGTCQDHLGAAFAYNGSEYIYYPFNNGEVGKEICAFVMHESGNFTIVPDGFAAGNTTIPFVGLLYNWTILEGDNKGRGAWEDTFYFNEGAGVPVAASVEASVKKSRVKSKTIAPRMEIGESTPVNFVFKGRKEIVF